MRHIRWTLACWLILGVSLSSKSVLSQAIQPPADESAIPSSPDPDWPFRYDLFQMLVQERGLRSIESLSEAMRSPRESVIVLAGALPRQMYTRDWERLVDFIQNGGTLLIASESSFEARRFGTMQPGPVTTPNRSDQYMGFSDCLLVGPVASHLETMRGVDAIATNRCGWFEPELLSWLNWEPLVTLPFDCRPSSARGKPVIALGRSSDDLAGLVIVSADASLFTNGMMWHGDNAVAAIRISELLCPPQKTQMLFVADTRVMPAYQDAPLPPSAMPPDRQLPQPEMQKALSLANNILKEIGDSNVLNEALRQQPRNVSRPRYFQALLTFAAACFVLGILAFLIFTKPPINARYLSRRRMKPGIEVRHQLGNQDYRNEAGYLARDFCWGLTGSRRSTDWQHFMANENRVGNLPKADRVQLSRIVDIACRGCQSAMGRADFELLGKSIRRLEQHRQVEA